MLKRRSLLRAGASVAGASWLSGVQARKPSADPVKVLAASDLKFALTDVVEAYTKEFGQTVQVTFGSSGNLMRQIQQGLAADVFMSADEGFVFALAKAGRTWRESTGAIYGRGRLALWAGQSVPVALDARMEGVRSNWAAIHKFAIAQPDHAPYGRAAREALLACGLWDMVQPKLVLGDGVLQAMQFLTTGAAQVGITSLSLALVPQFQPMGRYVVLPESLHSVLNQRAVLLPDASAAGHAFFAYLQSAKSREILTKSGFSQAA